MAVEQRPMPTPVPMPMPPMPMPPKKPMPAPMPPAYHPPSYHHGVPCIPCDLNMLTQMYQHMKRCHRYEEEMMKKLMRMCKKHKYRRGCDPCESSYGRDRYCESSYRHDYCESSHHRHRRGDCESSYHRRRDCYESSDCRPKKPCSDC
ncbi:hypothetical protein SAMN05444416_102119 [Thermoactinomyces sp. DSM 45892]|nr:hypothetical protein SAMN05444416_102119 [Thermoactinomyces sp. DSM 45892]